jgi:hypothetical protein
VDAQPVPLRDDAATPMSQPATPAAGHASAQAWSPSLAALRLVGNGRSVAMLAPDAAVLWWCAPEFDDLPLCWRLLDADGGTARFPDLEYVDAGAAPAAPSATTVLRDAIGLIDVRDGIVDRGDGLALVRLLRRRSGRTAPQRGPVAHHLTLGGFDAPFVDWALDGPQASGALTSPSQRRMLCVQGGRHEVSGNALITRLDVTDQAWSALVVAVDASADGRPADLVAELAGMDAAERERLEDVRLPGSHPERARDALAVCGRARHGPPERSWRHRRRPCRRRQGTTGSSTTATPGCVTPRCRPPSRRCWAAVTMPGATWRSSIARGVTRTC